MAKAPYREQLQGMAHALRQEGLSQAQIAREMGVPRETICKWLKKQIGQNDLCNGPPLRYLVVQGVVEKFRPLGGTRRRGRAPPAPGVVRRELGPHLS